MEKETWVEDFRIGFDIIDSQNKKIFTIIDDLIFIKKSDNKINNVDKLKRIIEKLEIMSFHFDISELDNLNRSIDLDNMIINYEKFVSRIKKFIIDFKSNKPTLIDEIILFLKQWLITQIFIGQKIYKNEYI